MTLRGPFIPEQLLALFLDVDGTLLELAATPDSVRVPGALRNTLELAAQREGGALALISGRSIETLDRLFAPSVFPASGQHGYERRDARGRVTQATVACALLRPVREALQTWACRHSGALLEDKGAALALHFRNAPALESEVAALMSAAAVAVAPHYRLRQGKFVLELAPAECSKRLAIEAFMHETPFAGRIPVFVGDDITDEEGFDAVNMLGGHSIRVGGRGPTAARYHFATAGGVVAWLRERNTRIMRSL